MTNIKRGGKLKIERKIPQYKKVTKQDLRLARYIGKMRKRASLTQEELALKIKKSVVWSQEGF